MKTHPASLALICAIGALAVSCQEKEPESNTPAVPTAATVELLTHTKGTFTVAETITLNPEQKQFSLGGHTFTIKNRWDDAEMTRETNNTNPREAHAVELSWTNRKQQAETRWIFPTEGEDAAVLLKGTTILPRLLPPGARITTSQQLQQSLLSGVQFSWQNKHYPIPAIGGNVFPGWKLVQSRLFKHALLSDSGMITESTDSSFQNRAVELTIESNNGSKERHICFIDHPKLTSGIHPTLLPVSRVSGDQASLSRLVVCETIQPPAEKSLIVISPDISGEQLTLWTWEKGKPLPSEQRITQLPVTAKLGEQEVIINRHWTHARRQIKWSQREQPSAEGKQPALLIETGGHIHSKQFVLIAGKTTPCKVTNDMVMLRYQPTAADEEK